MQAGPPRSIEARGRRLTVSRTTATLVYVASATGMPGLAFLPKPRAVRAMPVGDLASGDVGQLSRWPELSVQAQTEHSRCLPRSHGFYPTHGPSHSSLEAR